MTWITTVPLIDASGEFAEIYAAIASARGGVAAVHQAQSLNPRAMQAHLELYKAIVFARSSLSRIARERIAVVVSHANGCVYCVNHHAAALRSLGDDTLVVASLMQGDLSLLEGPERTLLSWAYRGVVMPSNATQGDVHELRAAGFDDRAILDATLTIAYFSFVNRIVLLLGVELEQQFETTCGHHIADATSENALKSGS